MVHRPSARDNGLPPPPPSASHHVRTFHVIALLQANRFGELVQLSEAARQLNTSVARLMDWRTGTARVRDGKFWYTSTVEVARLRAVIAGGVA